MLSGYICLNDGDAVRLHYPRVRRDNVSRTRVYYIPGHKRTARQTGRLTRADGIYQRLRLLPRLAQDTLCAQICRQRGNGVQYHGNDNGARADIPVEYPGKQGGKYQKDSGQIRNRSQFILFLLCPVLLPKLLCPDARALFRLVSVKPLNSIRAELVCHLLRGELIPFLIHLLIHTPCGSCLSPADTTLITGLASGDAPSPGASIITSVTVSPYLRISSSAMPSSTCV